ncbi:alcohol dehydrogenase catalytic domain-containing protein [Actinomadura madurae]|uniref:alcohol dehydrogenase catalytic domain-containing protein n=1 Tax=Actinomadura madurae TaxID=1993 RepID=UPI0020D25904|nr:alcohol dehydrogenase catalytic domain-containing protein [Actinomadura madurae]MCQ0014432.1 alcohol dehydrogenase catalytic domain-containing protein [Actinomadura madurae]
MPKPGIVEDGDAVVRVDAVTICGTDLHILKGDVPAVTDGRILGHEAVGTVEAVGPGVRTVKPGDQVLVSCITACGRCRFCREGRYGQCLGGEAGFWVTGSMGRRPSTCGCRSPTLRCTRCRRGCPRRTC